MPIYEFHCEKCEQDSRDSGSILGLDGHAVPKVWVCQIAEETSVFAHSGAGSGGWFRRRRAVVQWQ
jgi:hypothetical protein